MYFLEVVLYWALSGAGLFAQSTSLASISYKSYASLGDSYASGDGAGSSKLLPNFDIACGRFSDAYPIQIANSTLLDIEPSAFRNLACGGASTTSVLRLQAPLIGNSQVATLTVGGNEVDFFVLLNECVQQWRPFSTCEAEMERSKNLIESSTFIESYDRMIEGIVKRLKTGARLLVTGYATFFNEETDQCDSISFSTTEPTNLLTKELRRKFNDLVRRLNVIIKATAISQGAEYVDLEAIFDGHRFCEEGVVEPDSKRKDTWFFNLEYDGDAPIGDFFDLTKVFHPTSLGHRAIAHAIVRQILEG